MEKTNTKLKGIRKKKQTRENMEKENQVSGIGIESHSIRFYFKDHRTHSISILKPYLLVFNSQ